MEVNDDLKHKPPHVGVSFPEINVITFPVRNNIVAASAETVAPAYRIGPLWGPNPAHGSSAGAATMHHGGKGPDSAPSPGGGLPECPPSACLVGSAVPVPEAWTGRGL